MSVIPNPNLFNPDYDGGPFQLQGSSSVGVLLFHGFTATTLEVRSFGEFINAREKYIVESPLLPGHGTSPEDLSRTGYEKWLSSAESALEELEQKVKTVFLAGESMGGLLSLYLASKHPELAGLLVYAPALIIHDIWKAKLLHHFIFGSEKKLRQTEPGYLPWQGYMVNPLKAVVELGKLQKVLKPLLPTIKQPILIFQGRKDETIDIKSGRLVYDHVSSVRKELIELDESKHCILLDKGRDSVYKKSLDFIKSIAN